MDRDKIVQTLLEAAGELDPSEEEIVEAIERCRKFNFQNDKLGHVERLCYELAKLTDAVSIRPESDSSFSIHIPTLTGSVCIRCLCWPDDGAWKLETQVSKTNDRTIHHQEEQDHWKKVLDWCGQIADCIQDPEFDKDEVLADLELRARGNAALQKKAKGIISEVTDAYEDLLDKEPALSDLHVGFSKAVLLEDKVGRHEGPRNGVPYSIISVHPKAAKNLAYLDEVLRHEIIHFVLGKDDIENPHDEKFQSMAEEVGLPEKYRD